MDDDVDPQSGVVEVLLLNASERLSNSRKADFLSVVGRILTSSPQ